MPPMHNGDNMGRSSLQPVTRGVRTLTPGFYVPTVCFFEPVTEDVDLTTTSKHAIRLAQAGVTGITVHGSNGEAIHLSSQERNSITENTRQALDSAGYASMPLMVGCSAQSTRETIQLCRDAYASGGDFALVLAPSYYRGLFDADTIMHFFTDVADASPIPIVIYNYPVAASGLDLDSDTITALSKHPNIVGCKFTCGNTGKLNRVATAQRLHSTKLASASNGNGNGNSNGNSHGNGTSSAGSTFLCFGGSGDFTLQTMIGGGSGIIGGIANLAPKTCMLLLNLYAEGKMQEAREVQDVLSRGDWAAIKSGVVGIKSAMQSHYGYGENARRPLPRPTTEARDTYAMQFKELADFEKAL
ncbi:dihydrodipicolinate synthase [Arthroderma uncinatum]|uniref:dihydrodipicolinate synthase n=1 Tax=Arthroderma uncinatum TaxID=74035 RepID=UPI00144A720C|nr:dihydrodipicolinate synthase [Arthroderma uncinatum]KAF3491957.1 dihydrodipicolinate synthase [Arthroderma uncinatum]